MLNVGGLRERVPRVLFIGEVFGKERTDRKGTAAGLASRRRWEMFTMDGTVVLTHIPSTLFSVFYFTIDLRRTASQWGLVIFLETVQMTSSQGHAVVHAHKALKST